MIRQQPKRLGVRAQIKLGDSESLPWVDASFDYVFGVDSFHPYPNPKRALNEFHRARKPRVAVENDIHGLESGNIVTGVFTPVLAKHSKSFSLIDCISVGVDRMQRNFEPMRKVEAWQRSELTDVTATVVIYEAFVEGKLDAPKHLARTVHDLYFKPKYEEFRPRTIWSLSNAFTSAFKELESIPQFKATAKLGEFLETRFLQWF
jgi:ubiquinone/menaquinone biosynthesis C-methylase UbiE